MQELGGLHQARLLSICRCRKGGYSNAEQETFEELVERCCHYERFEVGAQGEHESEPNDE